MLPRRSARAVLACWGTKGRLQSRGTAGLPRARARALGQQAAGVVAAPAPGAKARRHPGDRVDVLRHLPVDGRQQQGGKHPPVARPVVEFIAQERGAHRPLIEEGGGGRCRRQRAACAPPGSASGPGPAPGSGGRAPRRGGRAKNRDKRRTGAGRAGRARRRSGPVTAAGPGARAARCSACCGCCCPP